MQLFLESLYPTLTPWYFIMFLSVALLLGMAKAGIGGVGLAIIPVMALIFGAKKSTGVLLPMMIIADIMAVAYYRRSAIWRHIIRVIPWVAVGIVIALITGNIINDRQFSVVMVTVVWIMVALLVLNDLRTKREKIVPENQWFASFIGVVGGFVTMIGNSAGPVFTLYFLAMRLSKKEFIGTGAWLYFIMNVGKFPLQMFVWKTITVNTLLLNLMAVPVIALGIFLGINIVKLFSESIYRYFIIVTTLIASIVLLV